MEDEASEVNKVTGDCVFLENPCNYLQEFIRAVLKCLGLMNSEPKHSSSNDKGGETSQGTADPPSSTEDPPADPPAATARLRIRPPPPPPSPPISGGGGPGTNANPS